MYINERKTQRCICMIGTQGPLYLGCALDHGHLVYGSKICPRGAAHAGKAAVLHGMTAV